MNKDSVVIVTGANSGLGKATASAFLSLGYHVVMACRSAERGERALNDLRAQTGGSAELMLCDLASLKSVEDFCRQFSVKHKRLDVLVNNAGTLFARRSETQDGFESNFGVNFLGHFLLTNRLLPILKKSAPSRIINISSVAHRFSKIRFDDINLERGYNWWRGYAQSKLAIVMFTYALAKKLEGAGITVNCVHPGIIGTNIIVNRENGSGTLLAHIQRKIFMPPERAAKPIVHLATATETNAITGRYFSLGTEKRSSSRSYDQSAADRLWALSESMCGFRGSINESEKPAFIEENSAAGQYF